ncbi:hypothetical protein F4780DRAFT_483800 [Xylariomycetidae sp. FL0641]|nr:hypothetical protein F4780DRAFT_483800 [Xylariomycetidae sp. FL0641]
MRCQPSAALAGLSATMGTAQKQTDPFYLKIKGTTNSSLDGYAGACHAGAAIEGLCYSPGEPSKGESYAMFNFNYTESVEEQDPVGTLVWNLPYTDGDNTTHFESQGMGLTYLVNSNVAAPQFGLSTYGTMNVGFDGDKLFGATYIDDKSFVPGKFPETIQNGKAYNWFVCWQYLTSYYYQSVGWAQTLPPQNPTCQPVTITKVDV